MTSYKEIYQKAIVLIDSYKFNRAIDNDPITFYRLMYPFLQDSWGQITRPMELVPYLQYRKEPIYMIEDFIGDGVSDSFNLSFNVEETSPINNYFKVILDGVKLIEDIDYSYNYTTNSIKFIYIPNVDSHIELTYYYVGEVIGTNDNSKVVILKDHTTQLIASFVVKNWIEKQKNRETLIRANIGAKEYQMYSPANALKENRELYELACDNIEKLQSNVDWTQFYGKSLNGGNFNILVEIRNK